MTIKQIRRFVLTAAGATSLSIAAPALAHVSLHPNTVPTGSAPTFVMRVPNEMSNARVVGVAMQVPPGITYLAPQPVPGWSSTVKTEKLAKPIKTDDGTVTEQPVQVTWTADKGGGTPVNDFQGFPVAIGVPGKAGDVLTFKTIQHYSNGKVVRWIQPPDGENPAPTINVTAEGGFLREQAGDAGPPAPGSSAATPTPTANAAPVTTTVATSNGASKGLGIAALIIAIVGLLLGGAAFARGAAAKKA